MKISEKDIGRRVVVNGEQNGQTFKNERGILRRIREHYFSINGVRNTGFGVAFDVARPDFHCMEDRCNDNQGWYVTEDMITFTDEENKMDRDFQEGEPVEHLLKGWSGTVSCINENHMEIKFSNGRGGIYHLNGKNDLGDNIPTIYHAGSIKREGGKIIIDPVKPVRTPAVNIYIDDKGEPLFGAVCPNEFTAKNCIITGGRGEYITTFVPEIQHVEPRLS